MLSLSSWLDFASGSYSSWLVHLWWAASSWTNLVLTPSQMH